jgi:hypothetical protein
MCLLIKATLLPAGSLGPPPHMTAKKNGRRTPDPGARAASIDELKRIHADQTVAVVTLVSPTTFLERPRD